MAGETPPDDDARQSLSREAAALLGDIPGLVTDRVRLFSLELKRATGAFEQMAALGLLAAILAATAWIALWAGIAAGFIAVGLAWFWVAPAVLVINVGGAAWCALRAKALVPLLTQPATLRHLTGDDSGASLARSEQSPGRAL